MMIMAFWQHRENIKKLISHTERKTYIKKKAALALSKIIKLCPELVDTVAGRITYIFEDKNHGVLISGLALVIQVFKSDPSYIKKNKKYRRNRKLK